MVKLCLTQNCKKKAEYGYFLEYKRLYCEDCKKDNMVLIKGLKFCRKGDCKKNACYGIKEDGVALYCKSDKEDHMVDVKHQKCVYEGCDTRPNFNYHDEEKALYCKKHALKNMVDINNDKCVHEECKTQPCFNYPNEKRGIYCGLHKINGMIDVKNKRCAHEDCDVQPLFNYPHIKSGIYCEKHALENMINVIDMRCKECGVQPSFNYPYIKRPEYCTLHKKDGMTNVTVTYCIIEDCKTIANFNYEGENKPLYCSPHSFIGMIDVKSTLCKSEHCYSYPSTGYEGYCFRCFLYMNPDSTKVKNYRTKEFAVVEYVKNNILNVDIVYNKRVQNGCSFRRPDMIIDMGSHCIVIEVDENQHKEYDCSCENKRIMEISQDIQHRPLVFIRFNPDKYHDINNKYIKSCWTLHPTNGHIYVNAKDKSKWEERLSVLTENINYWINNVPEKTVETIQLYYDQNF